MRRLFVLGTVAIGWLGLLAAWNLPRVQSAPPPAPEEAGRRPLEPETTAVRLLLGVGDAQPRSWDGRVELDQGEVLGVDGWRLRGGARVDGPRAWEAESLYLMKKAQAKAQAKAKKAQAKQSPQAKDAHGAPAPAGSVIVPSGVIVRLKAPAEATLTVTTPQGNAAVRLADLASGAPRPYLDGRLEARRVPASAPLAEGPLEQDFPAAVADGRGGAWVAYVEHAHRGPVVFESLTERPKSFKSLVPEGGGDQVKLVHFDGRRPGRAVDVTGPGLDVWRPAVAVDGRGRVVVAWSEQRDGNWDLFAREYEPDRGAWSEPRRLTTNPGTDTAVVLAAAPGGDVWMAWQAWLDGQAEILAAPLAGAAAPVNVSGHPANDWSPAIAVDGGGRVHVAFDSYRAGNYDVLLAQDVASGDRGRSRPVAVADSPRFEARPSLAIDRRGRAWVGYEERPANWGKDFGRASRNAGAGLYGTSAVRVRCVDGGRVLDVADPVAGAAEDERRMNSHARLACDDAGRPWLLFRHRQEALLSDVVMVAGGVWIEYATCLAGGAWAPPQPLPRSDGLLDSRPAAVATPGGPVLAFYNTDNRMHREVEHTPELSRKYFIQRGTPPGTVDNDLFVAALAAPASAASAEPTPGGPVAREEPVPPVHPDEAADVARMRAHRIEAGGRTYRLLRGEFHRHTETSWDGGNDGAIEDMWRYAIDAGGLDWLGNGDHDNGGGKEYTWWLTQKTTDLYHSPPAFVPMFTYERSVSYPGGHRNVMFPYRGVRTLPRLVDERGVRVDVAGRDEDAAMLYGYLVELGGICAAHTTATGMGTDWRQNDPRVETMVEVYQGARDSYEHLGAPRAARSAGEAAGGWRPLGIVWNALAMQYRLGFQSSSDHGSTHISFAVAIAEGPTRRAIFDAFKRRHCYAATDNIVLDVRSGDHLMGDEFEAEGPVTLDVVAHGTRPIRRVAIIKDFVYAFSTEPGTERVAFRWTDQERGRAGLSWYYVRVEQEDGELAWASPMWVRTRGRPGEGR